MGGYYKDRLSADRLRRCYEIAPLRVQQHLEAEIHHVLEAIRADSVVLELGCGYGRVMRPLAAKVRQVIGVDTSRASLLLAWDTLKGIPECSLVAMDAVQLGFADQLFDHVICIQNGISAFHVNQQDLIRESLRVVKVDGSALFSSYSDRFWKYRLKWFELQSDAGLVGEIDRTNTRDGVIACKDGFTATTVGREEFLGLAGLLGARARVVEVDGSSLFCEMRRCR